MTNKPNSSFIDAVEQRLGIAGAITSNPALWVAWPIVAKALTEVLAASGPVGEVNGSLLPAIFSDDMRLTCTRIGGPLPMGTLLFTTPQPDRVAELEAERDIYKNADLAMQDLYGEKHAECDELRTQLAAAQAAPCLPVCSYDAGDDVRIEAAQQRDGSVLWAIRRSRSVLNKEGEWEYEPMPSSRDEEFFARCRYASATEAATHFSAIATDQPAAGSEGKL
jgi:hypothetical protein